MIWLQWNLILVCSSPHMKVMIKLLYTVYVTIIMLMSIQMSLIFYYECTSRILLQQVNTYREGLHNSLQRIITNVPGICTVLVLNCWIHTTEITDKFLWTITVIRHFKSSINNVSLIGIEQFWDGHNCYIVNNWLLKINQMIDITSSLKFGLIVLCCTKKRSPHKRRQPKASTPDGPAAHPGEVQFDVAKRHCLPWRCRPHPPWCTQIKKGEWRPRWRHRDMQHKHNSHFSMRDLHIESLQYMDGVLSHPIEFVQVTSLQRYTTTTVIGH